MNKIRCPNCDAIIEIPKDSSTTVCPYCNTTVQIRTGSILKENYMMQLQFGLEDARSKMLSWAMKQLGAPKGLEDARIKDSKLTFWPFWVVEVEAAVDYTGSQKKPDFKERDVQHSLKWRTVDESDHIDVEQDIFIPANHDTPKQLTHYIIPTKRKEYFNRDKIQDAYAELMPAQVEREIAIQRAKETMETSLTEEVLKEVDSIKRIERDLQTPAVFLISVPIWHIKYTYGVRTYDALVDGASGRVVYLTFPRKIAFRAMTVLSGLLHLAVGGGIGLLLVYLGYLNSDFIFPTVFGISLGLGMLAISLIFFRAAASLRAGVEEAR